MVDWKGFQIQWETIALLEGGLLPGLISLSGQNQHYNDKMTIIMTLKVVNNTKYELTLNPDEKCGRECGCFGWQV